RADGRVQHFGRGHAELQAQSAVAVIQVEPVVRRSHDQTGRYEDRLVAGAGYLEENLVLPLELDFFVIQSTRQEHRAVCGDQLLAGELGSAFALGARLSRHASPDGGLGMESEN